MTTYNLSIDIYRPLDRSFQSFWCADADNIKEAEIWCKRGPPDPPLSAQVKTGRMLVARYDDDVLRTEAGSPVQRTAAFGKITSMKRGAPLIATCTNNGIISPDGRRIQSIYSSSHDGESIIAEAEGAPMEALVHAMCECMLRVVKEISECMDPNEAYVGHLGLITSVVTDIDAAMRGLAPRERNMKAVEDLDSEMWSAMSPNQGDDGPSELNKALFELTQGTRCLNDAVIAASNSQLVASEINLVAKCCAVIMTNMPDSKCGDIVPSVLRRHIKLPDVMLVLAAEDKHFGLIR